ncbi:unnamed protein product, partial [Rotaria magnacalcarata]
SSNVGSITDFLLTSDHSSLNHGETVLENSKSEDNMPESPNELNTSGNKEKLGHRRVDETGHVT